MNKRALYLFIAVLAIALILILAISGRFSTDDLQNPVGGANLPITLFLPNENVDGFIVKAAMTDGTAKNIVSLLVEHKALPLGCELFSFKLDGSGGATADMNSVYGQAINMGTAGEYMSLGCVVNTLLTFFELDYITITVEGKTAQTGHEIYNYPLRFYENQVVIY